MPKLVNERCLACAALTSHEARQKSCWDKVRCHKRRTFYRNKFSQPAQSVSGAVPVLEVPLPQTTYAILYRYLTPNGLHHAVGAELYQGAELVAKTKPLHVGALTDRVLRLYLQSVLETFSTHSGASVALFREMIDLSLERHSCPVEGCHLSRKYHE